MSFREEDRDKRSSSSGLSLGVAAVAIGAGVGAALYCFFSKTPEQPHAAGSSGSRWHTENTFDSDNDHDSEYETEESDGYETIAVNTTTDTSILEMSPVDRYRQQTQSPDESADLNVSVQTDSSDNFDIDIPSDSSSNSSFFDDAHQISPIHTDVSISDTSRFGSVDFSDSYSDDAISSDSDWETDLSVFAPSHVPRSNRSNASLKAVQAYYRKLRAKILKEQRLKEKKREDVFRQRSWTLEECSICFDIILKDHKVMTLPCTHRFHEQCIGPWLQEHQTCPNCRKAI